MSGRLVSQTENMRRNASALSQPAAGTLLSDSINKKRGPAALIEVLLTRGLHPDGMGEIFKLSREDAGAIRACGYTARAGRWGSVWRCPPLPDELVRGTHFFYLSDAVFRRFGYGPGEWRPKRASFHAIAPIDPLTRDERRIIGLLQRAPGHRLTRRQLQQRLSRRIPTWYLDRMLANPSLLGRTTTDGGWIYPFSRAELEVVRRRERDRRLTPVRSI